MKLSHLVVASTLVSLSTVTLADDYAIDLAHSSVNFTAGHLGFSYTVGRFNEFEGTFSDTAGSESVNVTIQAASIDTNHTERDTHMRSPDFFNAREYPTLAFSSSSLTDGKLAGELTMLGQTRPVELDVVLVGEGQDPWGGYRKGFVATTMLDRTDWGMDYFVPGVPADIEIEIHIEGIRQ